jgi:hypothetical protein
VINIIDEAFNKMFVNKKSNDDLKQGILVFIRSKYFNILDFILRI